MPRVTRAQLRAQESEGTPQIIHEDLEPISVSSTQEHVPFSAEISARPVLGEIHTNNMPASDHQQTQPTSSGHKANGSKKGTAINKNKYGLVLESTGNFLPGVDQEILEDESQSDASSAAEVAAEELRKDVPVPETFQVPMDLTRPRTPPSEAAREASRSLSRSPEKRSIAVHGSAVKTPKFDPIVHAQIPSFSQGTEQGNEDSFIKSIKSTTSRIMPSYDSAGDTPDSFVGDIISRSPSKYVGRIEDSVMAMDALEEAIEQVSRELPKPITNGVAAPLKTRTPTRAATSKANSKESAFRLAAKAIQTRHPSLSPTRPASARKTTTPNKVAKRKPAVPASSTRSQPRASTSNLLTTQAKAPRASTSVAPLSTTTKPATNNRPARQLSTSRPGFVPSKSAKPPTKSTFTLPGDAISAKLKAQREERLKKEEAEATKKITESKARLFPKTGPAGAAGSRNGSARISSVGLPRETAASRARMSLMIAKKESSGSFTKDDAGASGAKKTEIASSAVRSRSMKAAGSGSGPRKSLVPTSSTQSGLSVIKTRTRASATAPATSSPAKRNIKTTHRPSLVSKTTTTARQQPPVTSRATVPAKSSRASRVGSNVSPQPTATTTTTIGTATATATATGSAGTAKGKVVFSRGKLAEEEQLKQKREKEEAAKKARAEAAERGRKASREWAERQKRKAVVVVVVEGGLEGKKGTEKEVVKEMAIGEVRGEGGL